MSQLLKKWKPILDNILSPYELEIEILELLAEYLEKKLEPVSQYTAMGGILGIPSSSPVSPQRAHQAETEALGTIMEFKERLTKDVDIRVNVKNTYYNSTIKRIVYELENGDSVYLEGKPLIMKDPNYVKKSKNLFLAISDPKNPLVRKMKIEDIKNRL